MRHYYLASQEALAALPAGASYEAANVADTGHVFTSVDWEDVPNEQASWESRLDVDAWGTLFEKNIPAKSAATLKPHGIEAVDSCYESAKKMVKKFGGMRVRL